ncbi:hypothetical protein H4S06_000092 [Coemansia sp. BCRC 34490]|nr:hypothetical protein H4S06_000092 [Coemansia sp. BCRC 34490]
MSENDVSMATASSRNPRSRIARSATDIVTEAPSKQSITIPISQLSISKGCSDPAQLVLKARKFNGEDVVMSAERWIGLTKMFLEIYMPSASEFEKAVAATELLEGKVKVAVSYSIPTMLETLWEKVWNVDSSTQYYTRVITQIKARNLFKDIPASMYGEHALAVHEMMGSDDYGASLIAECLYDLDTQVFYDMELLLQQVRAEHMQRLCRKFQTSYDITNVAGNRAQINRSSISSQKPKKHRPLNAPQAAQGVAPRISTPAPGPTRAPAMAPIVPPPSTAQVATARAPANAPAMAPKVLAAQ